METIRKISSEEIDNLYVFTRKHFVTHYDLQTELVDHLANAIELRWKVNPAVSFDDALSAEFKKFGVFGFSDIVEQRSKALGKRYRKLMWQYFREFFTLPKVMLTISMIVAMRLLLDFNTYVALGVYIVVNTIYWRKMLKNIKFFKNKAKKTGRKWMFEEMIFNGAALTGLAGLWFNLGRFVLNESNTYLLWTAAFLWVMIALYNHVVTYLIPAKAEQYLKETYPEYGLA